MSLGSVFIYFFAEDLVGIKYWNFICLVISWLIIYAILCKGIASSGKVDIDIIDIIDDMRYDMVDHLCNPLQRHCILGKGGYHG